MGSAKIREFQYRWKKLIAFSILTVTTVEQLLARFLKFDSEPHASSSMNVN